MRSAFRNCPICNHDQIDVLHTQRFELLEGHPLQDGYDVVCCDRCGFIYADTTVTQADYDRFYAEHSKYEHPQTGTGGVENPFDWQRQQETARQIDKFLDNSAAGIVDVGCANGGLLKALKELGYQSLCGLDPSPTCVENVRRLGIDAHVGSLLNSFREHAFDCVVLSHTLEHINDLDAAMRWIGNAMKNNAFLYIEVPDASRYTEFADSPFQDFNTEHINHFSMASLKNFLKANGFSPVECGEKVIPASANKPYPAIYCFAQKTGDELPIEKDNSLRPKIEAYIVKSELILQEIELRLQAAWGKSKRIIVWGTGQLTMKLLVETSLARAEIVAFVDSNPINQRKSLRGIQIIAPAEVHQLSEPILISSTLHQKSISEQIHKMGLSNPLILLKDP